MENSPPVDLSDAGSGSSLQRPLSVCMHVLTKARNDVRVMREAETLTKAGFAVYVVDIESDPTRPVEEFLRGVCLKHVSVSGGFSATRFRKRTLSRAAGMLMKSIRRLLSVRADVYHAHDDAALPACAIVSLLRHKPLVFDAHELPLDELSIRWPWLLLLFKGILKLVLPRCAGVITVSPPIVQEIYDTYHPETVTLVRNILPYQHVEKSDRLREALNLSPHMRVALYQGILQANRGLEKLIYAAHFLDPGNVIVLMGQDMKGSREQIEGLITQEGVEDRVKLLSSVPYSELLTWTASADLGLIIYDPAYTLNVRMCLPNKLFEYLMAGLPVLASELVAIKPLLQTHGAGQVVSSLEPQEIGRVINTLLADRTALAEMSANARRAAQETLCWEQECGYLLNLYSNILIHQKANLKRG